MSLIKAQEIPVELKDRYDWLEKAQNSSLKKTKISSDITEQMLFDVAIRTISTVKSANGVLLDLAADQITSTNNFLNFWDFAYEPRKEIVNDPDEYGALGFFLNQFTLSEMEASSLIHFIEDSSSTFSSQGRNLTEAVKAGLYLFKGISGGYSGLLFDQGVDISIDQYYNTDLEISEMMLSLVPADSLIDRSVRDIEESIRIVESLSDEDFEWFFVETGREVTREAFIKIANSLIAKILINAPRSVADDVNYAKILSHANAGLDDGFPNILLKTVDNSTELADYYNDYSNFIIGDINSGAGFLPTDVKILHLLDDDYPTSYPAEHAQGAQATFGEASSIDPRLAYYKYTTNAGILNSSRDPLLYSNYFSIRTYAENDWHKAPFPIILMTQAELQYIKAEAEFMLGNVMEANNVLQDSPYGNKPADFSIDLPSVQLGHMEQNGFAFNGPAITSDEEAFINILHKEYSIEVSTLTTIGTHLFFMRRHGLLQELTFTELPVPAEISKSNQLPVYSSGGIANYENGRSAQRDSAWHISGKYPTPSGFKASVMSEKATLSWDLFPASYPDQPTEFNLEGIIVDPHTNNYQLSGLDNNKEYVYSLSATDGMKEGEQASVIFTPNIFSTTTKVGFEKPVLTDETATTSLWLRNNLDSPINIQSVKKISTVEDTTLNENWLEFINLDFNEKTVINSGDSVKATVSLSSEFYGAYPAIIYNLATDNGDFKLKIESSFINLNGNFEEASSWSTFHDAVDSVAFGAMAPGEIDTAEFTIKNKSLYGGSVDTLYTERIEGTSIFEDAIFSIIDVETPIWLKSGESHRFLVEAAPQTSSSYEARVRRNGTMFGSTIFNKLTVNNGERVITSNEDEPNFPEKVKLFNNYPNPFNPSTNIMFSLPKTSEVSLIVYNLLGQKVSTLVNARMSAGTHSVIFDASNLSSGMYFYRLQTAGKVFTEKMMLIK